MWGQPVMCTRTHISRISERKSAQSSLKRWCKRALAHARIRSHVSLHARARARVFTRPHAARCTTHAGVSAPTEQASAGIAQYGDTPERHSELYLDLMLALEVCSVDSLSWPDLPGPHARNATQRKKPPRTAVQRNAGRVSSQGAVAVLHLLKTEMARRAGTQGRG